MHGRTCRGQPEYAHYVPQTYLRAWADSSGQVGVRRRRQRSAFLASVANVGVEAHLYGSGAAATWRESNFSVLEGAWPQLRRELTASGHLHGRDRDQASVVAASAYPVCPVDAIPHFIPVAGFTDDLAALAAVLGAIAANIRVPHVRAARASADDTSWNARSAAHQHRSEG